MRARVCLSLCLRLCLRLVFRFRARFLKAVGAGTWNWGLTGVATTNNRGRESGNAHVAMSFSKPWGSLVMASQRIGVQPHPRFSPTQSAQEKGSFMFQTVVLFFNLGTE